MRRDIIVVENFYNNPHEVIEYAKSLNYYYPYQHKQDVEAGITDLTWKSSWMTPTAKCPFRSSKTVIQKLEEITGEKVDMDYWNRDLKLPTGLSEEDFYNNFLANKHMINKNHNREDYDFSKDGISLWNCSFQIKVGGNEFEGIHHHVDDYWHAVGEHGWNAIVYLNEKAPLRTGIKFWKHKYGLDDEWMTPNERWNMIDEMGNVFNRMILFRGDMPHSGCRGFGSTPDDGRLFQLFFFKTVDPLITKPLAVDLP